MCKKTDLISKELQELLPKDADVMVSIRVKCERMSDTSVIIKKLKPYYLVSFCDYDTDVFKDDGGSGTAYFFLRAHEADRCHI